uniref:Uncharacterized protein n=1 Tax=Arundo donax TaxID=35708 RepID=A0A0A8ZJA7_ARUDO
MGSDRLAPVILSCRPPPSRAALPATARAFSNRVCCRFYCRRRPRTSTRCAASSQLRVGLLSRSGWGGTEGIWGFDRAGCGQGES